MPVSSWTPKRMAGQGFQMPGDLFERVQHRGQVTVADQGGVAGHVAGQDVDLGTGAEDGAGIGTLVGGGDKEPPRAGLGEALHDAGQGQDRRRRP